MSCPLLKQTENEIPLYLIFIPKITSHFSYTIWLSTTSFPGTFPWLGGKVPGNEGGLSREKARGQGKLEIMFLKLNGG